MGGTKPRSHAFVIRIWLERAGEEEAWRGHVTDVVTEERHHFVELAEIVVFVRRCLQRSEAPGAPPVE